MQIIIFVMRVIEACDTQGFNIKAISINAVTEGMGEPNYWSHGDANEWCCGETGIKVRLTVVMPGVSSDRRSRIFRLFFFWLFLISNSDSTLNYCVVFPDGKSIAHKWPRPWTKFWPVFWGESHYFGTHNDCSQRTAFSCRTCSRQAWGIRRVQAWQVNILCHSSRLNR